MPARTVSRFLRMAASALGLLLAGAIVFDLAAFFLFPGVVQRIEPKYANDVGIEILRETRAQRYYKASDTRGFDIVPGARSVDWRPPDIEPYEIWGNSVGCFDAEPPENTTPDIYLAGDSFTWGFAPYEAKFGTVIEERTGLLVYACGVMNTGQRHQFDKFLDISANFPGWPDLVIVNVFLQDYADDYAFPYSPVANSVFIEDKIRKIFPSIYIKYYLKTYSATANIVANASRKLIRDLLADRQPVEQPQDREVYPIRSDIAAPHRRAIETWLAHAGTQDYQLRFALIPDIKGVATDVYREFREYLSEVGGIAWDFGVYLRKRKVPPEGLFWPNDGHFNVRGNSVYADFLLHRLRSEAQAGLLPARFAKLRAQSREESTSAR